MRRLVLLLPGTFTATTLFAHEMAGDSSLLQTVHSGTSPHHWQGLLLLLAITVTAFVLLRRFLRQE